MLVYAITLFVLAAVFGIYMLLRVFGGALPPWQAAALHGLFAAAGLVLLLYVTFLAGTPQPQAVTISAILLVIAALGGFFLVSYHARKQVPPKGVAALHALLAVGGVGALAASMLGMI